MRISLSFLNVSEKSFPLRRIPLFVHAQEHASVDT